MTEQDHTGVPRYQTLIRKDVRLEPEQLEDLEQICRRVKRRRVNKTEAITVNTLLRLGADVVIAHADQLWGDTEDDLRGALFAALARSGR